MFKKLLFFRKNPHMINVAKRYAKKKRNSSDKLLNMAIIGCGGAGLMHTSHYLWHKQSMVKSIYDIDKARFDDVKNRFPFAYKDIGLTTSFDDIISNDEIDAVSITSPDHTHAKYAIAALNAGKHVLCEKPMCTTIEDAKKIVSATKNTNKTFAVFQQMRFVPRNRKIKEMINDSKLGDVYFISTGYIHDMRKRSTEFSDWRINDKNFQHPIFGAIHHIDLLRWLGGEIDQVNTIATNEGFKDYPIDDTYITQIKLKSGGIGNIITCYSPRVKKEFHPLRIYGTKGSVHDCEVFLERENGIERIYLDNASYQGVPQFRQQISAFIDKINGKGDSTVSAEDGLKTVETCCAAIESWEIGSPVSIA